MYIKRFFLVALITSLAAFALGIVLDLRYKKRWSTLYFQKTDELIKDSTYYDCIYLGNSRVHFGINPYYVDSVTGLSSYNFGLGGSDGQEMMLVGNLFLQNHRPPKAVVMSLDAGSFVPPYSIKTRFPFLFYVNNDSVSKYVRLVYPAAFALKLLPFLKYSLFDEYNRTSLFVDGNPYPVYGQNIYRGFLNIHVNEGANNDATFNVPQNDSIIISEKSISNIESLISNFLKAGTKVIIISPPEIPGASDQIVGLHKLSDSLISLVAKDKNVYYFNFRKSAMLESKHFTDEIHLTEKGARIFSIQLADSLKMIL